MGKKGERRTAQAKDSAEALVGRLERFGSISARGMFGGYGIFAGDVMFGLVNTMGTVHFRADEATRRHYVAVGSESHGKMPYFTVPSEILADENNLCEWASEAIRVAAAAKKKPRSNKKVKEQ